MANGLARAGRLSASDLAWRRHTNARLEELYGDPTVLAPECYDQVAHPGARSWFRERATTLIEETQAYLALLDRYCIGWVELRTTSPGRVTYADEVQGVAVPYSYPAD